MLLRISHNQLYQGIVSKLRDAGLVADERKGIWMYYSSNHKSELSSSMVGDIHHFCVDMKEINDDFIRHRGYMARKDQLKCLEL